VDRFRRIIACWKGLELRNPDTLQVITSCKTLQVIPYKNENIAEKRLISHGILHETIKYYICMERGKIREASDGNQNCKKFNIICEI
jgi:hypothetical protein